MTLLRCSPSLACLIFVVLWIPIVFVDSPLTSRDNDLLVSATPAASDGKSVLVTGAAGFLGMHASLALKERGDGVVGLDNFGAESYDPWMKRARHQSLKSKGIVVLEGDIHDHALLQSVFQVVSFSHVLHLAYDGPLLSLNLPACSVTSLRTSTVTVYGPWGRPDASYFELARRIRDGEALNPNPQGGILDLLYVDDAVRAMLLVLDNGGTECDLVASIRITLPDLADVLQSLMNKKKKKKKKTSIPDQQLHVGLSKFVKWFNQHHEQQFEELKMHMKQPQT